MIWEMICPGLKAAREHGVRSPLLEAGPLKGRHPGGGTITGTVELDNPPLPASLLTRATRHYHHARHSRVSSAQKPP